MNTWKKTLAAALSLLLTSPALSAGRAPSPSQGAARKGSTGAGVPAAERYARRCQSHAPERGWKPQGTSLWGTWQTWSSRQQGTERHSVLVSADFGAPLLTDARVRGLRLDNGRLVAIPQASTSLVGTVLRGASSEGQSVDVALCGAEPAPEDPNMIWYRIEAWNPVAQQWQNPCVSTAAVSDPRALVVRGVWDASGAHHEVPGKLTLACETGVITKCIHWGYKPWEHRQGQSLAELHQACTRMARADYCGDGRSHTHEGTLIDMYDALGMLSPTAESSAGWNPAQASFEAAWAADGAQCLSRTRDGRALETVLAECPGRFQVGAPVDLGQGDHCGVRRADMRPETVLLRNRSYDNAMSAVSQSQTQ